jgi:hypothetical protein
MTAIEEILPLDAYLATCYQDWRNKVVTRRIYYNNGRVEAFDGNAWWTVCRFSPLQTELAKKAIRKSGLAEAENLTAADVYDTAVLAYAWRLDEKEGLVNNFAYPALDHPAFELLEAELEKLTGE